MNRYKQWDINEMCKWIGLIDKGRFKKYLDVFKRGFELDSEEGTILKCFLCLLRLKL